MSAAEMAAGQRAGASGDGSPALEVRGLTKRFGGVIALQDVNLDLRHGEIMAVVGDNGAGKSTLLSILSGNNRPTSGELLVDGAVRVFHKPADAAAAGIATVYQDLALALDLDVIDNLFLGREVCRGGLLGRWFKWLDRPAMRDEAVAALERVRVRIPDLTAECSKLSGGQRQALAIARAAAWAKNILLLDEPTAALGVEQQRVVLDLVTRVRDAGMATVLVSHQLAHVLEVADRIAVFRLGGVVRVLTREEANVELLLGLITGLDSGEA
jgi:ABC-type sugar transport system ATPase subunit